MSHKRYHLRDVDDSPGGPPDKRTKLEKESLLTYKPDDSNSLCAQTKRQAYQTEMEGANTAMMDIQHFPSNTDYKRDESTEHGNLQSYEEMSCEWMDALMARLYRLERTNAAFHERFTKLEQKNEKQSSKRAQTDNLRGVDMTSKEEQNQAGNSLDVVHREKNRLGRKDFELQQKFHKQSPKEAKSDRLRDVIMILKEERNQLERDLDLVQRQNDTLWRESIGLKQKVHELMNKEADADKLKDVMKTMENDRIQLEDKLKAVQQQNADLIEDTEALGNARQSVPNLDDAIENQFRDLRESVRSFTRDCSIKSSSLPDKLKLELARLFGNSVAKLLKSTLYARYLVEAYIWHFLYNYILQSPFGVWGYGRHCKIGTFVLEVHSNRNLTLSRRELWRKLTAQFLNDVVQPNIERIGGWQAFLIRRLEHLVKAEHETTLADHVKQIVNEAVELAKSLVMSSTLYALQREERGVQDGLAQKYSNAWMEIIEKSIEHYDEVDFLVSPALVQVANSAGEVFEPLRVIIKAEVCFSKGRSHMYDDSTSKPPTNEEDLVGMTQSGRAIRSVDRLGNVVDEAELNEAIGDEQNEVLDSDSDAYRDESASEVD